MSNTLMVKHAVAILLVVMVNIVIACTAAQRRVTEQTLSISAATCVAIAKARGREDVATYCGIAQDMVPVLETALAAGACDVTPRDAGAE